VAGLLRRRARASGTTSHRPTRARASKARWRLSRRWKRVVAVGGGLFALCIALVAGLVVYAAATLPDITSIGKATGTIRILDSHGTLIAEVGHDSVNRHDVTIDQIAPILQQSTVAAEDRNFYNEGAINPARVLKALVDDIILRRPAEGASTITQQLAKQAFFGASAEKSPLRKVREALLANQLDSRYTKQQILDQYLNITYYGENAYGIENASMRYFGKSAKDLTLPEAALLAGLPEAPSFNDPYNNPDAAYARMNYVLGSLVAVGDIKQSDADAVDPLVGGSNPTAAQQAGPLTRYDAAQRRTPAVGRSDWPELADQAENKQRQSERHRDRVRERHVRPKQDPVVHTRVAIDGLPPLRHPRVSLSAAGAALGELAPSEALALDTLRGGLPTPVDQRRRCSALHGVFAVQLVRDRLDVAHPRVVPNLVGLGGPLDEPEAQCARGRDQEQAVVVLLEPQGQCRQGERDAPTLHGQEPLVETGHNVHEAVVLHHQVVVEVTCSPGIVGCIVRHV